MRSGMASPTKIYRCVLVHGTFARNATWTQQGSPLRREIAQALQAEDNFDLFELVQWSGRNWLASRKVAALKIKQKIDETPEGDPILLVGHSHGGSAIAYLLKRWPDTVNRVCGIAFLSTPFISLRARREIKSLLSASIVISSLALYFLAGFAISLFITR